MDSDQQLYIEYRTLTEQLKKIQEYLRQTQENITELGTLKESFDRFKQLKKGQRVLAPIANGIFIDAKLNATDRFYMNIGAQTVVAKSIDEAKALLTKQQEEMERLRDRAQRDEATLLQRMRQIELRVQEHEKE